MPSYLDDVLKETNLLQRIRRQSSDYRKYETPAEVEHRFALLRLARSKERFGPVRTGTNERTFGDNADEITDEEIEYRCFGTTDPELKAVIMANTIDPKIQDRKERCTKAKLRRDSTTKEEKRESRQKVHGYALIYDDDTPEQAEQRYQKYLEYHKNNKTTYNNTDQY